MFSDWHLDIYRWLWTWNKIIIYSCKRAWKWVLASHNKIPFYNSSFILISATVVSYWDYYIVAYAKYKMHFSVRTSVPKLCAQLLLHPLMEFVHTHTQWPTWKEDDRKEGNWGCCQFYMSYGTFLLYIIPLLMFVLAINVQLLFNA